MDDVLNRTGQINARVSIAERATLETAGRLVGMSASGFMRDVALRRALELLNEKVGERVSDRSDPTA